MVYIPMIWRSAVFLFALLFMSATGMLYCAWCAITLVYVSECIAIIRRQHAYIACSDSRGSRWHASRRIKQALR